MTLAAAVLDALIEAGATAEMIVAAVKADQAGDELRLADKRAKDAKRKQESRDRHAMSHGQHVTDADIADVTDLGFPQKKQRSKPLSHIPPITPLFPIESALDAWNEMAKACGLSVASGATGKRLAAVKARIAEHGEPGFRKAVEAVSRSKFCRGENDRNWKADIGFLLRPDNFVKLIEGGYGSDATPPSKPQTAEQWHETCQRFADRAEQCGKLAEAAEWRRKAEAKRGGNVHSIGALVGQIAAGASP